MRVLRKVLAAGLGCLAVSAAAQDWPQLQGNPQRTGCTAARPEPPYAVKWQWSPMPHDTLNTMAQPVATRKAVFMPTNHGMLYALAAADGKELWKARIGSGCFQSVACESGRVFALSLDGEAVAFDAETGAELWRTRGPGLSGFVTAPLLAEGRLFAGDLNGNMAAFEQADGSIAWTRDLGAPIVQSAAYNRPAEGGRVYVAAQDMRMRALASAGGELVWTSEKLSGMSMEPYYPLVHNGYVITRTMLLSTVVSVAIDRFVEMNWFAPPGEWEKFFAERPERQDLFVLDEKTGREAFKAPHQQARVRAGGPVPPPAVDADGKLIITIYTDVGAGWPQGTWGRLDLAARTIEPIGVAAHNRKLLEAAGIDVEATIHGVHDKARGGEARLGAGGNSDETNLFSAGGRLVFFSHDLESAQGEFMGYYDLDKKLWWFMGIGSPQGRKWGGNPPDGYNGILGSRGFNPPGYSNGGHAFAITENRIYHHAFEVLAAWGSASE